MKNELARALRTDFMAFARKAIYENEGTKISRDPYLEVIATHLMDVVDGKTKRLILNLPPRHLKTQLGSICLAAWILAHDPKAKILVVTYASDLAEMIARSVRSILRAEWFKKIFDTRILKGHAKKMDFGTTEGGGLRAAPIDGSVTGFGADYIIVDDPHNMTDASYPERLERTIARFGSVVMSRLNNRKRGRIIVIAHRIHERDLSADLLGSGGWTHVALPLIATRDQTYNTPYGVWHRRKDTLLQPDADELEAVERLRKKLVNPSFDLLHQQDVDGQALPSITEQHFRFYHADNLPQLPRVISIDAGTDKGDHRSYSVIQVWATDGHDFYLVDQFRERCDYYDLVNRAKRFAKRHWNCPIVIERAANGPALISELTKRLQKRVYDVTPRGSKAARFRPHIEKIHSGRIHLPRNASFCQDFVQEFIEFPHGRHTDQVDAFSQAMTWLDENPAFGSSQSGNGRPTSPVVGLNSQYVGPNLRSQPKPNDRALMVVRGNSNRYF